MFEEGAHSIHVASFPVNPLTCRAHAEGFMCLGDIIGDSLSGFFFRDKNEGFVTKGATGSEFFRLNHFRESMDKPF